MRTPLIAGNWKMNGSKALIDAFGQAFASAALPTSIVSLGLLATLDLQHNRLAAMPPARVRLACVRVRAPSSIYTA